jgi:hypothetical protein
MAEVTDCMTGRLAGTEKNLLVYYNFNDLVSNAGLRDLSSRGTQGVLLGEAQLIAGGAPLKAASKFESAARYLTGFGIPGLCALIVAIGLGIGTLIRVVSP